MPTFSLKLNLNDRDREAFAHKMGKPRATYVDIITDMRRECYALLLEYRHEYQQDTELQDNTHKEQDV
jgi:hypothetical protein